MLRFPDPVLAFRLYPERRTLFYRVMVFATKNQMHRAWATFQQRRTINKADRNAEAVVSTVRAIQGRRTLPFLGLILFHRGQVSRAVVSHEMTHAAVATLRRLGADLGNLNDDSHEIDERLAWIQGDLVGRFWQRIERAGWAISNKAA